MSYSQYNEESLILSQVPETGRFLDIGAFHPTCFSNTRALFERGWSGVMVEPSPGPFRALLDAYGKEPRIKLINAAIGPDRHCYEFHATDDAVSTMDPAQFDKWKNAADFHGTFYVVTITLEDVFRQFGGGYDFVNIDTEGSSVDVLRALLATEALPKCICVEHDGRVDEVRGLALARGYAVLMDNGTNMVIAR